MSGSSDFSGSLSELFRRVGGKSNFDIIQALLSSDDTPSGLSSRLGWAHSTIRSQLNNLRDMGFLNYRRDGVNHVYYIREELPSLNHELIVKLIELDRFETDESPDTDVSLSESTKEKIKHKERERTKTKIKYLLSFTQYPGLTSYGKKQEYLSDKLQRLNSEIQQLKLQN